MLVLNKYWHSTIIAQGIAITWMTFPFGMEKNIYVSRTNTKISMYVAAHVIESF